MSDSAKNLEIKITTAADLAALQKSRAELEELKRSAIATGVSTAGLDGEIAALDKQIVNAAKGTKDGAGATKLFSGETREFHRTLGELNRGGLGPLSEALRGLAGGPGGLVFLAIGAFIQAKEALDNWNKSLDEAIAKNAEPTFAAGIEAKRKALEESGQAYDAWIAKVKAAAENQDEVAEALSRTITLLNAQSAAIREVDAATSALQKSQVQYEVHTGQLTPEQGKALEGAHEIEENSRRATADEQKRNAELAIQQAALADRARQNPILEGLAKTASEQARAADAKAKNDDFREKDAEEAVKQAKSKLDAASKAEEEAKNPSMWERGLDVFGDIGLEGAAEEAQANTEKAGKDLNQAQANLTRVRGQTTTDTATAKGADDAAEQARKNFESNNTELNKLTQAIITLEKTVAEQNKAEQQSTFEKNATVAYGLNLTLHGRVMKTQEDVIAAMNELLKWADQIDSKLGQVRARSPGGS